MAGPPKQLLYAELLQRPGGPWSWNEPGNTRERAIPRHAFSSLLEQCDVRSLAKAEQACLQWREFMISPDGVGVWQVVVHRTLGRERIEKYKTALGLRSGQSFEAEKVDLTARNWKRILRMHRASKLLPTYEDEPFVSRLVGHTGPVLCMTLGGPYLYTGGADKVLHMYRVPVLVNYTHESGHTRPPPRPSRSFGPKGFAHAGPILCVAAERECIISGSVDGTVKMWKVESAPESPPNKLMLGHQGPVWCVCLMRRRCMSGGADKTIMIWNLDSPKGAAASNVMKGHTAGVTSLCVSAHNNQVISASEDKTVRIWDLDTCVCVTVLEGHTCVVFCVQCWQGSREGKDYDVIFSGDGDGTIRVWDRRSGMQIMCAHDSHADAIKGMAMSLSPEHSLITSSMDGTVRLWRPDKMVCERVLADEDGTPVEAGFTMALAWANVVLSSSWDGVVRCYVYTE